MPRVTIERPGFVKDLLPGQLGFAAGRAFVLKSQQVWVDPLATLWPEPAPELGLTIPLERLADGSLVTPAQYRRQMARHQNPGADWPAVLLSNGPLSEKHGSFSDKNEGVKMSQIKEEKTITTANRRKTVAELIGTHNRLNEGVHNEAFNNAVFDLLSALDRTGPVVHPHPVIGPDCVYICSERPDPEKIQQSCLITRRLRAGESYPLAREVLAP